MRANSVWEISIRVFVRARVALRTWKVTLPKVQERAPETVAVYLDGLRGRVSDVLEVSIACARDFDL